MPRILLVDDDDLLRKMLRITLVKMGHEVFEAHSGEEAIYQVHGAAPDILITDIIMPGKEGLEIIGELRRLQPAAKILAISGSGRIVKTNYLKMARAQGADAVLAKPFSNEELATVLRQLLESTNLET